MAIRLSTVVGSIDSNQIYMAIFLFKDKNCSYILDILFLELKMSYLRQDSIAVKICFNLT